MVDTSTNSYSHLSHAKIEPLESSADWPIWSMQIEDLLFDQDVFGYADGTEKRPAEVKDTNGKITNATEIAKWDNTDRKVRGAIRSRLGKNTNGSARGATSAADLWAKLKSVHEPKGLSRILDIKFKMATMRYAEGEDLAAWLQSMVNMKEELSALGRPMPDEDFSIQLLTSLPASWRPFARSFRSTELADTYTIVGHI